MEAPGFCCPWRKEPNSAEKELSPLRLSGRVSEKGPGAPSRLWRCTKPKVPPPPPQTFTGEWINVLKWPQILSCIHPG